MENSRRPISIWTWIITIWLLFGSSAEKSAPLSSSVWAKDNNASLKAGTIQLRQAIHSAAAYLTKSCDASGKFLYRINTIPDIRLKPKYNFLRHAGAIYALTSYAQSYPRNMTKNAIKRASDYLKTTAISPLPQRTDLLAVWSHPAITGSRKPLQAKLGGTGLGLIALLAAEKIMPGTTPIPFLRKMGNFIIYMQKTDGSFYSKYIPETSQRDDSWTSLYYPGEAALGLLMLYEKDPSLIWLQAAADAMAYLSRKRKGKKQVEADHWALLATARLLPLYDQCRQPVPKQALLSHAIQICEGILAARPDFYHDALLKGSFMADGRTTPTSIRLEGMLALLGFLPVEHHDLRKRMFAAIDEGMLFLLRSQIRSGEFTGGIPRAIRKISEKQPGYSKSFNRRATEVRIDYVQHALSAMLQYEQTFN